MTYGVWSFRAVRSSKPLNSGPARTGYRKLHFKFEIRIHLFLFISYFCFGFSAKFHEIVQYIYSVFLFSIGSCLNC